MAVSSIINKEELTNFTTLPIGRRILSAAGACKKHISETCDIRRYPRTGRKHYSLPQGIKPNELKSSAAVQRQNEEKANKALEQKRKDLIHIVKITSAKWSDLEGKEKKLKTWFVQYHEFVRQSAEKRERFLLRLQLDHAVVVQRTAQTEILKLQVEKYRIIQQLFSMEINKHSIYHKYLGKVVDRTYRFISVYDLLRNFEFVILSLEKLTQKYHQSMQELEENFKKVKYMIICKDTEVLDLRLKLNRLSKLYDGVFSQNFENEKLILKICSKIHESTMEYEECLRDINGIYSHACRRLKINEIYGKHDYKNQIFFIKSILGPLKQLRKHFVR